MSETPTFKYIISLEKLYRKNIEMEINAYHYTAGPLGTKWLDALKDGKLKAARCSRCGTIYIPPKIYCPKCYSEATDLVEINDTGYIESYAIIYRDNQGRKLEKPEIIALIRFPGVYGGLIHRVNIDPKEIKIGIKVKPVFRKERRGSINDIEYFAKI
ncbi:MAG: Zn-ribbon domain-containing OB-fold protein [Sulfolobales archaeon]